MILNNLNEKAVEVDGLFEMIHEVKNSIAVCSGYLDIIDSNVEEDVNKYLSVIRSEINRSRSIIKDFMLLKKTDINIEELDISILIEELCEEMSFFISSKGIVFESNIIDDEVYINGDYNKLKQVFINLIKNSVEAIDSNGKIKIVSYVEDGYYFVVVKDNGCGMSRDDLNKIGTNNFTTKVSGSGIGVNFCKKVVMEHGGNIEYISKLKRGTKVFVKLPIIMI